MKKRAKKKKALVAARPPTAYIHRDEYGGFKVDPAALALDLTQGNRIRFVNVAAVPVSIELPRGLRGMPGQFRLGRGSEQVVRVGTRARNTYPYSVEAAGFRARGGSGPKVIVDP